MTEEERAYHACRDPGHLTEVDGAGRTPLHTAAHLGKAAICRIYLNAGCDPLATDNSGRTAADLAKAAGYSSLARSLEKLAIDAAANARRDDIGSRDSLLDAVEQRGLVSGDTHIIDEVIASGRLGSRNSKGDTPLHLVAAGGHLTACSALFDAGADPAAKNNAKQTPADMAAEAGYGELARLLRRPIAAEPSGDLSGQAEAGEETAAESAAPPFASDFVLDEMEFDSTEDPADFHTRQQISPVSARFVAIPSGSGVKSGGPEDNDQWDLPVSLAKVFPPALVVRARSSEGVATPDNAPDFSYSTGRRAFRQPRKLKGTKFELAAAACRQWCADALAMGGVDHRHIRDLVLECRGNHDPAELAVNVRKALQYAGIQADLVRESPPGMPEAVPDDIDPETLSEAIHAICNRDTIVPGKHAFAVDRAAEEKLVREMGNARRALLNGILDDPALLSDVVRCGELVLAGETAADAFTDVDLEVEDDDNESAATFASHLEHLRAASVDGIETSGRARRSTLKALDELEIRRSFLEELAAEHGNATKNSIGKLLNACDFSIDELVLAHLPYMRRETAKMAKGEEEPEDLFQEAYFGMRRAAERFDPERGVRFYVYAQYWIRQQISRWRVNHGTMIRMPAYQYQLHAKLASFAEDFQQTHFRLPSDYEMAAASGCDVRTIRSMARALSDPLDFSRVAASTSDSADSPEDIALRRQAETLLKRELEELDDRQQAIVRMRFGIDRESDMTLEEIGQIYGLTRERIRQIEATALKKLSHGSRRRFLQELR